MTLATRREFGGRCNINSVVKSRIDGRGESARSPATKAPSLTATAHAVGLIRSSVANSPRCRIGSGVMFCSVIEVSHSDMAAPRASGDRRHLYRPAVSDMRGETSIREFPPPRETNDAILSLSSGPRTVLPWACRQIGNFRRATPRKTAPNRFSVFCCVRRPLRRRSSRASVSARSSSSMSCALLFPACAALVGNVNLARAGPATR